MKISTPYFRALAVLLFALVFSISVAQAQTGAFTYQGQLNDGATVANGTYQMQFSLFDAAANGTQIGATITNTTVSVLNGIFTVQLDFTTTPFAAGATRFLQIAVKKPSDAIYTNLSPRQQITSSPYSIRTITANLSDALSANCVGCVDDAKIASVAGGKVTGTVANATNATNATTATTAGNVTGTVAVANGGTGSTTKNFVDLTTAQTVVGNKTFNNTVSAATLSAGTGGLNMNGNLVRLRDSADNNHGMLYNTAVDGPEFRAFGGFRWANGANGATQRMLLDGSGNLTIGGTFNGTLADNSVGTAQVADGSLRVSDLAINSQAINLATFTLGAHGCAAFNLNGGGAVGDLLTIYLANNTPAGFYVQPTIFTTAGAAAVNICNTLNANNVFPTQNIRVVITRP